jgi:hypothetical protein
LLAGSGRRSRPWAWSCAAAASAGSGALDPKPEIVRYQRERPGELIHLDIKKLGRIDGVGHRITGDRTQRRLVGWDFLHVAIDDACASPTPRSCPTSARKVPSPSLSGRWTGSPAWASPSSGS